MQPSKQGLAYFPLNTDFFDDMKILKIAALHGIAGELVALKLTALIYKAGYSMPWDDITEKVFASRVMCDASLPIHDIVESLFTVGYFDRETYNRTGKLTSRGIQRRWVTARKACKQPYIIDPELNLLSERDAEDSGKVLEGSGKVLEDSGKVLEGSGKVLEGSGKVPGNSAVNKKEKKRKGKERKEKEIYKEKENKERKENSPESALSGRRPPGAVVYEESALWV